MPKVHPDPDSARTVDDVDRRRPELSRGASASAQYGHAPFSDNDEPDMFDPAAYQGQAILTRKDREDVPEEDFSDVEIARPPRWYQVIWSAKKARVGVIMLAFIVLVAIFAPVIAPYDPLDSSFAPVEPVSAEHLLGTTTQGYDIFSQLVWGTRLSLAIGLLGGFFVTVVALIIGMIAGYAEGTWVDEVLSFITNLALVVPVLPLMMVLVAYSETRGLGLLVIVIAITSWAGHARGKRAQIITLRNRDFVTAAKFAGEGTGRIVFREIMPNMTSLVVSGFIAAATGAIGAEAGLSFMGFGDPNTISWGQMLNQANVNGALVQGLWAWLVVPGVALALLITALTYVNFGVDLLSNPHLREDA